MILVFRELKFQLYKNWSFFKPKLNINKNCVKIFKYSKSIF